jgi:hypothetical protein
MGGKSWSPGSTVSRLPLLSVEHEEALVDMAFRHRCATSPTKVICLVSLAIILERKGSLQCHLMQPSSKAWRIFIRLCGARSPAPALS